MTIFFNAEEEHAIATVWYIQTRQQAHRSQFRRLRVSGWILVVASLFLALLLFIKFSVVALAMATLYGVLAYTFLNQEKIQRKVVAQAVKNGAAKTVTGPQEYTLTPQGIRHKSRYDDGLFSWDGIAKIEVTDTHLAFHFSDMQAFLVPKSAFGGEAHWMQFLQLAQNYRLQAAQLPQQQQQLVIPTTLPVTPQATATPMPPATSTTSTPASGGGWWTQGQGVVEDRQENRRS